MREDGKGLRRLTRNRVAHYSPIWSPDGKRIASVSNRDGDDELYLMDSNGRTVRRLTSNRGGDLDPAVVAGRPADRVRVRPGPCGVRKLGPARGTSRCAGGTWFPTSDA
jgi:WD40-like Beta Propeller Repeat